MTEHTAASGGFEVRNAEIERTMNGLARRVGAGLPDGWGFLLMLFEYGTDRHPGSSFYISSAERADSVGLLKDWIARQGADGAVHVTTAAGRKSVEQMDNQWHKIAGLLMLKLGLRDVAITMDDLKAFEAIPDASVVFGHGDDPGTLRVQVVDGATARRLAYEQAAKQAGKGA